MELKLSTCNHKINKCIKALNTIYPQYKWQNLIFIKHNKIYIQDKIPVKIWSDLSNIFTQTFYDIANDFYINFNTYYNEKAYRVEGITVKSDHKDTYIIKIKKGE